MKRYYYGKCACGQTEVKLELPQPIPILVPKSCDCEFCISKNASYISHPQGKLSVTSKSPLREEYQGSRQAKFSVCQGCDQLVMVTCMINSTLRGTLNARILDCFETLFEGVTVSPRLLSASVKRSRWERSWLQVDYSD